MLERTDAITNEVLEPSTFVLPTLIFSFCTEERTLVMCNAAGYYLHFAQSHLYFAAICRIALYSYFVGMVLRVLSRLYDSQETSPFLEEMMNELAQLATGVYLTKSA